jgi:[protein-PII] uridylyltransferase
MTTISFRNVNNALSVVVARRANGTVPRVPTGSLRDVRSDLLASGEVTGIDFCHRYAAAADQWLAECAEGAAAADNSRLALVAVGGYGRGELSPFSDLDLLLIHDSVRRVDDVANRMWYPIWDAGISLDHSVRTPKEVLAVAAEDLRVALGLLDARVIWGSDALAKPVIDKVRERWSGLWGDRFLAELEAQMAVRHEQFGDLADLLEPDLKEARGGLRDVNALEAVRWAFPDVARFASFDEVFSARDTLLAARVAIHRVTLRSGDRLLLQDQDQVAASAGYADADVLMTSVSAAARVVARASDACWRRRRHWMQFGSTSPAAATSMGDGIELYDGEVRLANGAPTKTDVTLCMRLAACAAAHDRPIALESLERLAVESPSPPTPWPSALRKAFVDLLGAGDGLVGVVEALDAYGLFSRHVPEWDHVRAFHQRNAYHRFTVDRHLLETVRHAWERANDVSQPDLLLLGALFHDIGKGLAGDHTEIGTDLTQSIGPRIGLSDADSATLVLMVRHHLLLSDVATRRDLDDPVTIRYVAAAVGDEQTLELLHALSRADGIATGPSAWGQWKAQLVDELAARVRRVLQGHDLVVASPHHGDITEAVAAEGLVVRLEGDWLIVATEDRPGLLAAVTGALALLGIDIRSADLAGIDGVAIDRFYCVPGPRGWPTTEALSAAITRAIEDPAGLRLGLGERAATYSGRRRSARPIEAVARAIPAASDASSVVEVVAVDEIGLLSRIAQEVAAAGFDVTAARLTTVGDVAVDTFYLRSPTGGPLDVEEMDRLVHAIDTVIVAR